MNLSKKSDSKFILDSPDQSIKIILKIDIDHHNIFYDIYLINYQIHMRQKTITNFEKMYTLSRNHGQWHLPKYLPDTWMILDELNNWANKTNYKIKGKILT